MLALLGGNMHGFCRLLNMFALNCGADFFCIKFSVMSAIDRYAH
jgi:hypothetical protein